MANKRSPRVSLVLQSFRKWSGRLLIALLILVFLFASVALLQHWFIHVQLYRTTRQELGLWARKVVEEIAYKEKWDLKKAGGWNSIGGYQRANQSYMDEN